MDDFVRLATDFDEIWDRGIEVLDVVKENLLRFKENINNATKLDTISLPVHNMPWMADHDIDQKFARFEVIKEDLQRFIARLPSNTLIHQIRIKMFKDLLKYRYEVERIAQLILTDHRKPIYPPALMRELKPQP